MNCCYLRNDHSDPCDARRMEGLPMCQRHMLRTFRDALVQGALPRDVFQQIAAEATDLLMAGRKAYDQELDQYLHQAKVARRREQEAERARREASSLVYYLALTGDRIKIGWTGNLEQRIATFRARPEDVLATEPGGRSMEARRHRQFATERIGRSEDFTASDRLRRHVEALGVHGA